MARFAPHQWLRSFRQPVHRPCHPRSLVLDTLEDRALPAFLTPVTYGVGQVPSSVAVGDFNGDGIPDLVTTDQSSNTVSVLLGAGDGTFQPARPLLAGNRPFFVAVGDFNGDGISDLAIANYGENTVSILLGVGDGTFQPAQDFAAGYDPSSVVVGDFNNDGIPDLATTNFLAGTVSVLLGVGDGTFQPRRTITVGGVGGMPRTLAVGDFNGDGNPDLAVVNYASVGDNASSVIVLLGVGDGTFTTAQTLRAGYNVVSAAVGDFNGDGIPDLAVANFGGGTVSVFLGAGDGTFQPAGSYDTGGASAVAVGDFNGDGVLDLAVTNDSVNGSVSVLLGVGDGTFQLAGTYETNGQFPRAVTVGDFNGDGWTDLAVLDTGSNDISILLNDADWGTGPRGNSAPGEGSQRRIGDASDHPTGDMARASLSLPSQTLPQMGVPTLEARGTRQVEAQPRHLTWEGMQSALAIRTVTGERSSWFDFKASDPNARSVILERFLEEDGLGLVWTL